jgi:hypothetical protein
MSYSIPATDDAMRRAWIRFTDSVSYVDTMTFDDYTIEVSRVLELEFNGSMRHVKVKSLYTAMLDFKSHDDYIHFIMRCG